jgi:hypothetical protein
LKTETGLGTAVSSSFPYISSLLSTFRIQQILTQRLGESGWLDNLRHVYKGNLSEPISRGLRTSFAEKAKAGSPLAFERILEEMSTSPRSQGKNIYPINPRRRYKTTIHLTGAPTTPPLAIRKEVLALIRQQVEAQFEG